MRNSIIKILPFTVCLFAANVTTAQDTVISKNQIEKSIQKFADIVDTQDLKDLGVKNMAELKSLKAGRQFKRCMIGLDDIKNYKQGDDVNNIIKEYPSMEVSLVNGQGKIVTAIEFVKKNNNWEASGYGATSELILLRNSQSTIATGFINKGRLIRIPSLRMSFIAVASVAGLEFISLQDYPSFNLHKGQKMAASAAIQRLVPLAQKHNGDPT